MAPIKSFQESQGLKPDGQIGPLTFGALTMAYGLTPIQTAHFLSQLHHESAGFTLTTENLNYSAAGLLATFPAYYTPDLAKHHERKPSVIANHVYGGRMGNNRLNDGWHFRGRGLAQLTGRNNYTAFANWVGVPAILENPDLVAAKYALASAIWFFNVNKIFDLCVDLSEATAKRVGNAVNRGNPDAAKDPKGFEDRKKWLTFYSKFIT
jgi:putative chitinase